MLQFGTIPTSEFFYHIINQAIDQIKAIIHMINMKLRKLQKNDVRNQYKNDNLSKNSRSKGSKCPLFMHCRHAVSDSRTKKFSRNKNQ